VEPITIDRLEPYTDDRGNSIEIIGEAPDTAVRILFRGGNNRVRIETPARIGRLEVNFDCDNGALTIGPSKGVPAFASTMRIGQDSAVRIGANVSTTSVVSISATEGTTVTIGDDVMFASGNDIRADDGHPIFDVNTGKRVNVSRSIRIGNHVWLGRLAVILGGAEIGDGSVIGYGSLVTGRITNNCVAVGTPARAVRYDIAWERPHLSLVRPFYKPDGSTVPHSPYWATSVRPKGTAKGLPRRLLSGARRRVRRLLSAGRRRIGRIAAPLGR
jgi:acetyltransferase-like isoleucine patch superfamily enzyme